MVRFSRFAPLKLRERNRLRGSIVDDERVSQYKSQMKKTKHEPCRHIDEHPARGTILVKPPSNTDRLLRDRGETRTRSSHAAVVSLRKIPARGVQGVGGALFVLGGLALISANLRSSHWKWLKTSYFSQPDSGEISKRKENCRSRHQGDALSAKPVVV